MGKRFTDPPSRPGTLYFVQCLPSTNDEIEAPESEGFGKILFDLFFSPKTWHVWKGHSTGLGSTRNRIPVGYRPSPGPFLPASGTFLLQLHHPLEAASSKKGRSPFQDKVIVCTTSSSRSPPLVWPWISMLFSQPHCSLSVRVTKFINFIERQTPGRWFLLHFHPKC